MTEENYEELYEGLEVLRGMVRTEQRLAALQEERRIEAVVGELGGRTASAVRVLFSDARAGRMPGR